mgnify:CR=1 FL=1
MIDLQPKQELAIAVGLATHVQDRRTTQEHLEELCLLADTAGANVVQTIIQERPKIDSAFYIGKGKVEELTALVEQEKISLVIFDDDLSPVQIRNLEKRLERKIIDRSGLIIDIFAKRAKTNEAKTQVELAQLQYLLPRLTRQWTHLSKQFGGIGTKGPGETQIETDRRMIRERISTLKKKLEKIISHRNTQRSQRKNFYTIALAGYTNVGKSTLLNTLSQSSVFVQNRLFATLDATTRMITLGTNPNVLLTDTVGFIRKLPHHLVASFKSTLEEVREADIILHVVDVSHPAMEEQIEVVNTTLEELDDSGKTVVYVFNKIDALEEREEKILELQKKYSPSIFISASRGINIAGLKELLNVLIHQSFSEKEIHFPISEYKAIALLHSLVEILSQQYTDDTVILKVRVSEKNLRYVENIVEKYKGEIMSS